MNEKLRIRHTVEEDVPRIMEIYAYARAFMAAHGNPDQWGPNQWPPEDLIHQDIRDHHSYVCVADDRIVGTFFFVDGKDVEPTYRVIDGSWQNDEPYGVVHRIASDGSCRGVGSFCLEWAFEQCHHIRIDTHEDNVVMQNLLKKLGYAYCGIIYVHEDPDPRMAFEKCL